MPNIAVLMTSHNRRETTVECLRMLVGAVRELDGLEYTVYLTDDGSTDGTAEAVQALALPVRILRGPGDLFWNRGMLKSWHAATEQQPQHDGFVLLNDDTKLDRGALAALLDVDRAQSGSAVIVGATRDPVSGELTYGGLARTSSWHPGRLRRLPVHTEVQEADTFNANCVYIPAAIARVVGTLDEAYHHSMGDLDYGYRARHEGIPVVVAPFTVGVCARNSTQDTWRDDSLPLQRRLKLLKSPKGLPYDQWRTFLARHGAPLPTVVALGPLLTLLRSSMAMQIRQILFRK